MLTLFMVLYDPGINALNNIRKAISHNIEVVVYANRVSDEFSCMIHSQGVVLLGDNINRGLGYAFNEFEEYMMVKDKEYYVYFDQDTVVGEDAWRFISLNYMNLYAGNNEGLIFLCMSAKLNPRLVVSSGCLFSMRIIRQIGCHDPKYFVEGVDYEFCLRLRRFGYDIKSVPLNGIDHIVLQGNRYVNFFEYQIALRVYGDNRLRDFNLSHIKLMRDAIKYNQPQMFILFFKSLLAFNCAEFFSRFIIKFFI